MTQLTQKPIYMAEYDFRESRPRTHRLWMTVLLMLLIATYGFLSLTNFLPLLVNEYHTAYLKEYPNHPAWYLPLLATCEALNVASAAALLRWRRWGVFIFGIASLTICGAAYLVQNLELAVTSGVALVVLLVALILGSPRSTWSQLD